MIRQPPSSPNNLLARLLADNFLKIADHLRIRMWPQHRAEQIMSGAHVCDPIAHRLIDRVLQRAAACLNANHFSAEKAHAKHIQPLPLHVFRAHIHRARKSQSRRHGCRRHAVLSRASLRNHSLFLHAHSKQALPDAVIDFVRAGVKQILAFQINLRAAEMLRQSRGELQRRRPPGEIVEQVVKFSAERFIAARLQISPLQLFERRHECLRDVPSAERAKAPAIIRNRNWSCTHARCSLPLLTASISAYSRCRSFFPGLASTPLQISTANGSVAAIASATFSGVSPPAITIRPYFFAARPIRQSKVCPVPPRCWRSKPSSKNKSAESKRARRFTSNPRRIRNAFITG